MPTMEEYAKQPREQRMQRLTRTADELAAAIKGQSDAVLSRRPDAFLSLMAWHDDNHLDQLTRALQGRA